MNVRCVRRDARWQKSEELIALSGFLKRKGQNRRSGAFRRSTKKKKLLTFFDSWIFPRLTFSPLVLRSCSLLFLCPDKARLCRDALNSEKCFMSDCGWNMLLVELPSTRLKKSWTPHFRGVNYIFASSTLIGSLSTFMCQSRNPFIRVLWLTPPWHIGVWNTGWCRRYQSVGVNLDCEVSCEVSPTGWTFFSLHGETRNSPSLELNILCTWCFSIKVLIIWLTSTRSRDRAREIDGLLYWKLWTLPLW